MTIQEILNLENGTQFTIADMDDETIELCVKTENGAKAIKEGRFVENDVYGDRFDHYEVERNYTVADIKSWEGCDLTIEVATAEMVKLFNETK